MADQTTDVTGTMTESARKQGRPKAPAAPGGAVSPQMPGQVPDRSTVPGFHAKRVPAVRRPVRRPLTQYETAEEIMHVYPAPSDDPAPAEFEQATASDEELRRAYPWQLPPMIPSPVFALDQGVATKPPMLPGAEQPEALDAGPRGG